VLRVLMFAAVLLVAGGPVQAAERVRVGILKLTSSAPIFIGVEKGFFQEQGVDVELTFFQAAAPIATALAAGQIDVGATGLTAALYNIVLGGERIWIVADKGREWPGYPLTAIVVQKDLWDAGVRAVSDLKGRRIGVTRLGSTFHYQLGNVLEKEGLSLGDVKIAPLQAMSASLEALRGKQVAAITAKYTGASPDVIRVGFPYQDRNGRFPAEDIEKQMTWWVRHGFMKATIPRREIVDTSFVEAAIKALGE